MSRQCVDTSVVKIHVSIVVGKGVTFINERSPRESCYHDPVTECNWAINKPVSN